MSDGRLRYPQSLFEAPGTVGSPLPVYPLMYTLGDQMIGLWDSHQGSVRCPPLYGVQVRGPRLTFSQPDTQYVLEPSFPGMILTFLYAPVVPIFFDKFIR